MRVIHVAPFAPNACGLYEAARDMVVADRLCGHDADMVDTGCFVGAELTTAQGRVGLTDDRGRDTLVTVSQDELWRADVIVCHSGVPDPWISPCTAPLIWILHGRPLACFRPEQNDSRQHSYSLLCDLAKWPRVRAVVTMWPEHVPYWRLVMPPDKLRLLSAPPCDASRFSPAGPRYTLDKPGEFNVLVCDSWREDGDIFEIVHGALAARERIPGLKLHIVGGSHYERCWARLVNVLREEGLLATAVGRVPNMDRVYRAADCVLTPHRIITRVTCEALCCGKPVVAATGCRATEYCCDPTDMESVADALCLLHSDWVDNRGALAMSTQVTAKMFDLERIGGEMNVIYESVTSREEVTCDLV